MIERILNLMMSSSGMLFYVVLMAVLVTVLSILTIMRSIRQHTCHHEQFYEGRTGRIYCADCHKELGPWRRNPTGD